MISELRLDPLRNLSAVINSSLKEILSTSDPVKLLSKDTGSHRVAPAGIESATRREAADCLAIAPTVQSNVKSQTVRNGMKIIFQ